jgi:hypothetical protein
MMNMPCGSERTFLFRPSLLEAWKRGELIEGWCRDYPFLFDLDNRRNALGQCHRGYHFGEWFTAIALFQRFGLHSVVGKYVFLSHRWKTEAFNRIVTDQSVRAFLRGKLKGLPLKRPDLLVYGPDEPSDYCFIEVKVKADSLKALQQEHLKKIGQRTGKPWGLLHLRECEVADCLDSCFACDRNPRQREEAMNLKNA